MGLGSVARRSWAWAAALFYLYAARPAPLANDDETGSRAFATVTVFTAVLLWLTVIIGTHIIFPPSAPHRRQAPLI